jgi:hypothetical protein
MRIKDYLNDGFEVSAYVKAGTFTDILIKPATSEINNLTQKYAIVFFSEDQMM